MIKYWYNTSDTLIFPEFQNAWRSIHGWKGLHTVTFHELEMTKVETEKGGASAFIPTAPCVSIPASVMHEKGYSVLSPSLLPCWASGWREQVAGCLPPFSPTLSVWWASHAYTLLSNLSAARVCWKYNDRMDLLLFKKSRMSFRINDPLWPLLLSPLWPPTASAHGIPIYLYATKTNTAHPSYLWIPGKGYNT